MRRPERRPQPTGPLDGSAYAHAVAASPAWRLVIGTRTDPGRARPRNEDFLYAEPPDSADARAYGWFGAVADGVSSRPAGDVASSVAVHGARDAYYEAQADDTTERLHGAIEQANRVIHQAAR